MPAGVTTSIPEEEVPHAAAGLPPKPLWWRAGQVMHRTIARAAALLRRLVGLKPTSDKADSSRSLRELRCGSDLFDLQAGAQHTCMRLT